VLEFHQPLERAPESAPCGAKKSQIGPARAKDNKLVPAGGARRNSSKLNERTGNVVENKGALWKTRERSWNVVDNKSS
jgi:hypothetical protein